MPSQGSNPSREAADQTRYEVPGSLERIRADSPTPYPAGAELPDWTTQVEHEHGQLMQLFVPDWSAVYGSSD